MSESLNSKSVDARLANLEAQVRYLRIATITLLALLCCGVLMGLRPQPGKPPVIEASRVNIVNRGTVVATLGYNELFQCGEVRTYSLGGRELVTLLATTVEGRLPRIGGRVAVHEWIEGRDHAREVISLLGTKGGKLVIYSEDGNIIEQWTARQNDSQDEPP
jgi:hypothetical protein